MEKGKRIKKEEKVVMIHIKKFNENVEKEIDVSEEAALQMIDYFSKYLGVEATWLSEYLLECFEYNLDQSDMPFTMDEFETIVDKLTEITKKIK